MDDMYDIELIEREMVRQFLTVRKLGKLADVAAVTIKRIFRTHRGNPDTIGKLVRALGMNPADVVLPASPKTTETLIQSPASTSTKKTSEVA